MNRAYKQRDFGINLSRLVRAREFQNRRIQQRNHQLSIARNINNSYNSVSDDVHMRKLKLQKWKQERDMKKKLAAQNKKLAFVVGMVHHHFFSPTKNDPPFVYRHSGRKNCDKVPKWITPVTEKRLAAKQAASSIVTPGECTTGQKQRKTSANVKEQRKSFAPRNHKFQAPLGVKALPWGTSIISKDPEIDNRDLRLDVNILRSVKKYLIFSPTPPIINVTPATPFGKTPSKERKLSEPIDSSPLVSVRVLRNRTFLIEGTPRKSPARKVDVDHKINTQRGDYYCGPSTSATDDLVFDSPMADRRGK